MLFVCGVFILGNNKNLNSLKQKTTIDDLNQRYRSQKSLCDLSQVHGDDFLSILIYCRET